MDYVLDPQLRRPPCLSFHLLDCMGSIFGDILYLAHVSFSAHYTAVFSGIFFLCIFRSRIIFGVVVAGLTEVGASFRCGGALIASQSPSQLFMVRKRFLRQPRLFGGEGRGPGLAFYGAERPFSSVLKGFSAARRVG